jgi:hypothetical protein
VTERERRAVGGVLVAIVLLTVAYWTAWYADRPLVASNTRSAYYEFENAFPLADGWLALCCVAAVEGLARWRARTLLWLLLAGGAGIYLFCMDALYDVEHSIWWQSGGGGWLELGINVTTLALSIALLRWTWRRREAFTAAS